MKVVMLCEFFNEELDYQEALLAKYYRKLGCEVTVITSSATSVHDYIAAREERGAFAIEQGAYAKVVRVPLRARLFGRIRVLRSIRAVVEAERPDLLFFHDIVPNIVETLGYLRRHPACCAILDYHADYSNSGANWVSRLVLHRLTRRGVFALVRRRLSAILPILPDSQRFLRNLYGVPAAETEIFPLGVDLDLATTVRGSDARARVRRRLGIAPDALVVFTGGKLVPLKRTQDVLAAAAALADPRLHVVVVGNAEDAAYRAVLNAAAGAAQVHFVGWQDRIGVYEHQAAADLAIFPTSQSVLWQQSIGMGLPLVVSEGAGEIRARQDVGYMNQAANIHVLDRAAPLAPQIAAFLSKCLADRTRLRQMADGADHVARTYLSYERLARRTLEIAHAHAAGVRERKKIDAERRAQAG